MPQNLEFSVGKGGEEVTVPRPWRAVTPERGWGARKQRTHGQPILPHGPVSTIKSKGHSWNLTALLQFSTGFVYSKPNSLLKTMEKFLEAKADHISFPQTASFASLGMCFFHLFPPHWHRSPWPLPQFYPLSPPGLAAPTPLPTRNSFSSWAWRGSWHLFDELVRKPCIIAMYSSYTPGGQNARMVPKIPAPWCTYPAKSPPLECKTWDYNVISLRDMLH